MAQEQWQATMRDPIPGRGPETADRIFRALADERRRVAVAYLAEADGAVSRDELVDQVARETTDPGRLERDTQRVAVEFHHSHLPELEAAGLVDCDGGREVVYPTETAERVSSWIPER